MAYQINSIDYGDYRYSVGDTIKISPSAEYMYWSISNTGTTSTPGISAEVRKIAQIWQEDSAGSTVYNPILTEFVSGSTGYGTGFIRPEQIVVGSGGLKVKHKVTYNANGGSGAPGQQIKVYGSILTLSSTKPTRTGYTFLKWNTNTSGTGTSYSPGQQYGDDADITLYAIWTPVIYTVSFNANGGSGAPGAQTKTYGVNLTLSGTKPTRTNYNFLGWGVSPSSTTVAYNPGSTYTANSGITLYAIWQLAYKYPRISGLKADRCASDGTLKDDGTYAKVVFSWSTDRTVSAIKIEYKAPSDSTWTTVSVSGSGTSGSITKVIGGSFSTETNYDVHVTVSDSGGSSNRYTDIPYLNYIIDIRSNGNGVAIGKPANSDGFNVGMETRFDKDVRVDGRIHSNVAGSAWYNGRDKASLRNTTSSTNAFCVTLSMKTINGTYDIGTVKDNLCINYVSDTKYNNKDNAPDNRLILMDDGRILTKHGQVSIDQAANTHLWAGCLYMNDGQGVSLSQSVSSQKHGIVLRFSLYKNETTVTGYDYICFFIPKILNNNYVTVGPMINSTNEVCGYKWLKIEDTRILGNKVNTDRYVDASTGLVTSNNLFVLTDVYGV